MVSAETKKMEKPFNREMVCGKNEFLKASGYVRNFCKARFGHTGVLIAAFLVCWVPEPSSYTKSKDIF